MIDLEKIGAGKNVPGVVNAIIEIPKGRRSKFEFDKDLGVIRLDRYLHSACHYPGDYGFVPQTLAKDGDPLDVLVMVNEPTFPGCLIEARVIGLFRVIDRGEEDFKLLAVPAKDPIFGEYHDMDDVPRHFLRETEHFFRTYKELEGLTPITEGWAGREEALKVVTQAIALFNEQK